MVGEKCGLTVLVLVNAQSMMHIVFQLYDVIRFDSTVVINVLINLSSQKLNNLIFKIPKLRVHEYASGLTSTPDLRLNYSAVANAETLWVKIMSKFVNYKVTILSFYVKKLVALVITKDVGRLCEFAFVRLDGKLQCAFKRCDGSKQQS